jgi:hypothetical protein
LIVLFKLIRYEEEYIDYGCEWAGWYETV